MRNSLFATSLLVATVAIAPACATKKYVQTEVGDVNSKVTTLSGTVEQVQGRIQTDEARIGQVDQKAEAAGQSATAAQNSANAAQTAARQADAHATQVGTDAEATAASLRKLVFQVTLNEDQGNFKLGKTDLPDEAKARLDALVGQLKGDTKNNVFIEIEGHTDNTGSKDGNYKLGLERAEAVQRYLYMQHQIPLHKISVISYGQEKPVAPNNTKDGRAQNRRVVIRVLS
jgi:outer membrane protein OmpA-like peptidoglycan-associated protein